MTQCVWRGADDDTWSGANLEPWCESDARYEAFCTNGHGTPLCGRHVLPVRDKLERGEQMGCDRAYGRCLGTSVGIRSIAVEATIGGPVAVDGGLSS
jgi:hypothetical protein